MKWSTWIDTEWRSREAPVPPGGFVSLFTDANPQGWGAYARAEPTLLRQIGRGRFAEAGGVYVKRMDMTAAESMAIVHGVRLTLATWPDAKGIGVRTDSRPAIRLLLASRGHQRDELREIQGLLRQATHGVRVRFKWVAAHTGRDNFASRMNRRVQIRAGWTSGRIGARR
ncbi:MAG: hypothetical protein AAFY88_27305 [Acidobacteriota bacterium]